ncbi:sensor domain-containing diguanylate cyclase [Arcobacter vandammei]|uniref:sensor domain-containing diguanylate cyclase n=1 Tax=Arcobacter vandammei TaxID=2782243 RepID=UPI0018DFA06B|nr:diguanylate cyclase [Arcobacter vandammei]
MRVKNQNYFLNIDIRNFFIEWIFLIFFLISLSIFVSYLVFFQYEEIVQNEEERLSTQTRIVNNRISDEINSVYKALLSIRNSIEEFNMENNKDKNHMEEHIKMFIDVIPTIRSFLILNKEATVISSNKHELIGLNYSHREYYINAKTNSSREKLYISSPYKSTMGVWTINLSIILSDEKGNFNGMILAVFEPLKLMKILESIFYANDMRSTIIHGDGTVFLVAPFNKELLGKNLDDGDSYFYKHRLGNKLFSVYSGKSYLSNDERLVSFYTLRPEEIDIDTPLYITVSRDIDILYTNIKKEIFVVLALLLILILSSVIGLYLLQKRRYLLRQQEVEQEKEKRKILESYAYIDSLTQIANRRYFEQFMDKEWRYCLRNKKYLSIVLIDIDNFKLYNDKYGHQAGDECLKKVARVLDDNLNRSHDFVARYGGEEFICILPNTKIDDAKLICEKLRLEVEQLGILHEDSKPLNVVTVSIGLSCDIPNENLEIKDLIKKADNSLYISKKSGRNKVSLEN